MRPLGPNTWPNANTGVPTASPFTAFRPTIFGQRDPHLHAKRKRIVSHGYSMNALQAMERFVQERLQLFMKKMREFSRTGEQINLGKWCHFFAFDVIGELVRSPRCQCIELALY